MGPHFVFVSCMIHTPARGFPLRWAAVNEAAMRQLMQWSAEWRQVHTDENGEFSRSSGNISLMLYEEGNAIDRLVWSKASDVCVSRYVSCFKWLIVHQTALTPVPSDHTSFSSAVVPIWRELKGGGGKTVKQPSNICGCNLNDMFGLSEPANV